MLSRVVQQVLEGQFEQAGMERPRLYTWDRVHIARRAHANTGWELGHDPRDLAEALGFQLAAAKSRDCGRELAEGSVVSYGWSADRRERGLSVTHGIAHLLLRREGWDHTHADAWMLTGDLALPLRETRCFDVERVIREAHVPAEFVRGWLRLSARLGRSRLEEAA